MSVELYFNNEHASVTPGSSLFEYAESLGIRVPTSCLKQGKCKECLVEIVAGGECLSAPVAQEDHLLDNFRLSCRTRLVTDSGVVRCHTLRRGDMRIEKRAMRLPVQHQNLQLDPAVTREGERILLDGEIIDRRSGPIHGLAVDLGTTTVVIRLLNLETGEIIADAALENPQRFGGSEVMSRIHYDSTHRGKLLQRTLARYVNHAIEEFPVHPASIYEVVVAGNSTMRDLFFRLDVYSIGQSPYQSITELERAGGLRTTTSLTAPARRLLLRLNPKARAYGLPIISGHVGADAAACMLAVDIANAERLVAIMDIGTNTELIVGNKDKILAASCPAGPAFEGGNISCGMPGLPGAIERVRINDEGKADCSVIEGNEPQGICGSGLIDLLSELLRTGHLNTLGRFEHGDKRFVLHENGARPIYLNESDINELAQAKGANVAGLQIVFDEYGIGFEDLEVFYLAGGFGRHLNVEAAKRIGLIPNIDNTKILQVGNAAIEGACTALLSRSKRVELEDLVKRVRHCRLETHPGFFDYFVEGCQFKPFETMIQ
ncbi:ferredoxin [candidate division KSB1 bacterium]|nr:MAG: ferredoxin [candidate division KSB1 bacterium]